MLNLTERILKRTLQFMIRLYQLFVVPGMTLIFGTRCRFYPSCSHFASQCLTKHSFSSAMVRITGRISKCGPWHPGGIDYP